MGTNLLRIVPISLRSTEVFPSARLQLLWPALNSTLQMNCLPCTLRFSFLRRKPLSSPFGFPDAFPDEVSFSAFDSFPKKFIDVNEHLAV